MARLSKAQAKAHAEAEAILAKDRLSEAEKFFVLENWQESAHHVNNLAGAFFTPWPLARDLSIEVNRGRVIDLCAGIGVLSFFCERNADEIVCVEKNPDYVRVGRKMLPDARWIEGDIFDLPRDLGAFDFAISNPPFGAIKRAKATSPRYRGADFEYHVIDIASDLADYGVFIVPQMSAPFRYSGEQCFTRSASEKYAAFAGATSIALEPSCGIDTSVYRNDWRGVAPAVEVVTTDFIEARSRRLAGETPTLFADLPTDERSHRRQLRDRRAEVERAARERL